MGWNHLSWPCHPPPLPCRPPLPLTWVDQRMPSQLLRWLKQEWAWEEWEGEGEWGQQVEHRALWFIPLQGLQYQQQEEWEAEGWLGEDRARFSPPCLLLQY